MNFVENFLLKIPGFPKNLHVNAAYAYSKTFPHRCFMMHHKVPYYPIVIKFTCLSLSFGAFLQKNFMHGIVKIFENYKLI